MLINICKNYYQIIRDLLKNILLIFFYGSSIKAVPLVFLIMPFSLVSANTILVDENGMVMVYASTKKSNPIAPLLNEGISALPADAPVIYLGEVKQFELFSHFQVDGGALLENNQAYLTWWGVGHRMQITSKGNSIGETFYTRIKKPNGSSVQSKWVWGESGNCWQQQNQSSAWCFYKDQVWITGTSTTVSGTWNYELVYGEELDPDSIKEFNVIGMDMVSAGPTSLSGRAGATISQALEVKVVDYDGVSGAPGQPVRFSISSPPSTGFGLVSNYTSPSSGAGSSSINVTTDSQGIAKAYVELGAAGGSFTIKATSSSAPIDPPNHSADPVFTITSEKTELEGIDEEKNQGEANVGKYPCINAGNPINIATGNKFQKEVDLIGSSGSPLVFTRYYNLTESESESLGSNWRHTYNRSLSITKEGKGKNSITYAYIKRPDGRAFTLVDSGSGFIGDTDIYIKLMKKGGKWELHTTKDTIERYSGKGVLLSITNSKGNVKNLSYNNKGLLVEVVSSSNEVLEFYYDATTLLIGIDYWASNPNPVLGQSRSWSFGYTEDKLASVENPNGSLRLYHYENIDYPHALTGITDERGVRYATWEYDETGTGSSSFHGLGASRVDIAYDGNGVRTVTDSLGNVAYYETTAQLGQGIVTDREGPSCSTGESSTMAFNHDPVTNDKLSQTIDGTTTQYGNYDVNGNPGIKLRP